MDKNERRALGAHYTSEKNILKTIDGLFMDELREEFQVQRKKTNSKGLESLLERVRKIKLLDPACGCGNFLILSYRELRRLEMDIIQEIRNKNKESKEQELSVEWMGSLDVDMLYGIEIEEFPSQIAKTAIWIMDHLMNKEAGEKFGSYFVRLPLKKAPTIVNGNALRINWVDVIKPEDCTYILGNPPFIGSKYQSEIQREDMQKTFQDTNIKYGVLDYVYAFYKRAISFTRGYSIDIGFVSTNSIIQGEQPSIIWGWIFESGYRILFGHQTFRWTSDSRGKAAVHCVIIGLSKSKRDKFNLYKYQEIGGEPICEIVDNINPYLIKGSDTLISSRSRPICSESPKIGIGNKPIDGGSYLFEEDEMNEFVILEPSSRLYFKRWYGSVEFLNNKKRYCLIVKDIPVHEIRKLPHVLKRIENVKEFRSNSKSLPTKELSKYPTRFHVENFPQDNFLVIPKVSSEKRDYIPIGYLDPRECICSDLVFIVESSKLYDFGILQSSIHNSWMRRVAGRLKSDYRYSKDIVYNNFPWPEDPSDKQKKEVEDCAQSVLDARAEFPDSSLADLYDPLTMPKKLRDAHNKLDKAVDKCYRLKPLSSEAERVEFLFELYEKYTNTLTSQIKAAPKKKKQDK
ncbi:MAG: hypothetical protein JJT78_13660 [Leptospira sp.]|nr:hypothetical protein [Leptospira sp.]